MRDRAVRAAVLLSGRGSNMLALAEAAREAGSPYRITLVASDKPEAPGLSLARDMGVPTFAPSPKGIGKLALEAALDTALRDAGVEVIALAGYMRLLSSDFVARWRGRILNIHPSLLPKYKGLDTHARALAARDAVAGCSVHLVTEELDAGEVLGRAEVSILPGDTPDTLAARVLVEEHRLYPRVLADYARSMTDPLDRVRQTALAMPETEERVSHGQPTFFVAGKQFAQVRDDHHGDGLHVVCVRTGGADEQAMLIELDPATYSRPAYLGPSGWVGVNLAGEVDWPNVNEKIARSWELAAPRRLLEAGGR